MPLPDYSFYIPVICQQEDSKYNGKCFMEAISKVRELNGVSVSTDRCLLKSDFSTGDKVVIRFQGKNFSAVVDFSRELKATVQRVESPPVPNRDFTASSTTAESEPTKSAQPPVSVTAASTNSPVTKKRKRGEESQMDTNIQKRSRLQKKRRTSIPGKWILQSC